MANIKAVVFDYYETLGQLHQPARERLLDDIASNVGLDLAPGEAYKQWTEETTKDIELRFGGVRPSPDGEPFPFRTFWDVWRERFAQLFQRWEVDAGGEVGAEAYTKLHSDADVYPEVHGVLEELGRSCQLAVLSNADDAFLDASIEKNGLRFGTVVSSEEVRAYKPHVSIFRETCDRIGVDPSEALYVGDQPWADVEGSRHAGMGQAWVNRYGATWPDDVAPPQHTITSLTDLLSVVS